MFFPMEIIACGATWAPFLNKTHFIVHFDISKNSPIHKWGLAVFNHVDIWYGSQQQQNGSNLIYNLVVSGICKICRQELLQFSDIWLWYITRGLIGFITLGEPPRMAYHLPHLWPGPDTKYTHVDGKNIMALSPHCNDVIMGAMASHISSLTIVFSTVYSGADQRKHQSSASLAFVRGIHRSPVNSPHKWSVTRKMFPFDDVVIVIVIVIIILILIIIIFHSR